ncbi:MAG: ferritin [Bacteroidales bacterium]|nr:ferritin [Bacteroidales bacterium]
MLKEKVEDALNKQIELEAYSSQLYLSMASWAEKNGFNGSSEFLYIHADEERGHMLKLFHYINDRDGHAIVPPLKQPPVSFESITAVFEEILSHERMISDSINDLVAICVDEKDFTTQNFLQWYVSEQIEEENLAKTNLDKLNMLGDAKANMYLFDKDMAAQSTTGGGTAV